ncbi:DUF169 domain-containing protein [Methanosarcina sp. UBA5]|uniref:DUF169 domain-containing protein n=1 Tax=Methanosarcina sp. UBA5 TaxID=1915593 RepID=UPI0025E2CFDE|nr:DUF169 domain-containing protein [Methanosarcina sp. UBA5]
MDVKEVNHHGHELIKRLKIRASPVAVKLIPKGEKIPEGIGKTEEDMTHCQFVDKVRKNREEFYTLNDNQMCKVGAGAMGLGSVPENLVSGELYYKEFELFSTLGASRRTVDMTPTLPPNSTEAILYSPLEKTSFIPDVIMVFGSPKQMMLLTQAVMYGIGGRLETSFSGAQSVCSDGVVQVYKEGKVGVTIGCTGSRAYATLTDDEMIMGIPIELLADVVSGLKQVCP